MKQRAIYYFSFSNNNTIFILEYISLFSIPPFPVLRFHRARSCVDRRKLSSHVCGFIRTNITTMTRRSEPYLQVNNASRVLRRKTFPLTFVQFPLLVPIALSDAYTLYALAERGVMANDELYARSERVKLSIAEILRRQLVLRKILMRALKSTKRASSH